MSRAMPLHIPSTLSPLVGTLAVALVFALAAGLTDWLTHTKERR